MAYLRPGDAFWISGPHRNGRGTWRPGKRGGWQPRAWTSHPDDPDSKLIRPREGLVTEPHHYEHPLFVDFGRRFVVEEVRNCGPFVTVRVNVPEFPLQYIWINAAKDGKDWVRQRGRA